MAETWENVHITLKHTKSHPQKILTAVNQSGDPVKIKGIELAPLALALWALAHPIHSLANWGDEVLLIAAADEDDEDDDDDDDGGGSSYRSHTYQPIYSNYQRPPPPHHEASRHASRHPQSTTRTHATTRKAKSAFVRHRTSGTHSKSHGKVRTKSGLYQRKSGITGHSKSHHSVNARNSSRHSQKKTQHPSIHTKNTSSSKGRHLKSSRRFVAHKASHHELRKSDQRTQQKPSTKVTSIRTKK